MGSTDKIETWEWVVLILLFIGLVISSTCKLTYSPHYKVTIDNDDIYIDSIQQIDSLNIKTDVNK